MFNPKHRSGLLIATAVLFAVVAIAWKGREKTNTPHFNYQDTVPTPKKSSTHKKVKKIDNTIHVEVNDCDDNISDIEEINDEINDEMESVDWNTIDEQIENALDEVQEHIDELHERIDPETITNEVEGSLKNIDVENLHEEIERAVQQAIENIDFNEIESEIRRSVDKAVKEVKEQRYS